MTVTHPARFCEGGDAISVEFPDFAGCFTYGGTFEGATSAVEA